MIFENDIQMPKDDPETTKLKTELANLAKSIKEKAEAVR